jgi:hypothetical protein
MANNWIQKAVKHPGALRAKAKKAGELDKKTGKIKKSFIDKETHSKNPATRKQANLAKTFSKMRKK